MGRQAVPVNGGAWRRLRFFFLELGWPVAGWDLDWLFLRLGLRSLRTAAALHLVAAGLRTSAEDGHGTAVPVLHA